MGYMKSNRSDKFSSKFSELFTIYLLLIHSGIVQSFTKLIRS